MTTTNGRPPATLPRDLTAGAVVFLLALLHVAGKPGRAWASIRESEPASLAAGTYKVEVRAKLKAGEKQYAEDNDSVTAGTVHID